jgi:hypothetical protein
MIKHQTWIHTQQTSSNNTLLAWWNTAAGHPRGCGEVAKKHRQRNNQMHPQS